MKLHPYQRTAVHHLRHNSRAALFLDMGLGKTAITLRALTPDHLPALVVAPKRVAENVWSKEAATWRPDLSIAVAAGDPKKRAAALASGADIVVIGRDNIKDIDADTHTFRTLVLDELSGFKARGTQRWKLAKEIARTTPYCYGLTGTPAPNGLLDLWSQVYLLDGGERLGKTLTAYRGRYFYPGRTLSTGIVTEWHLRKESDHAIHELLKDLCLAMTAEDHLSLPAVTFNEVAVPLPANVRRIYKDMKDDLVAQVESGEVHSAASAAVMTNKLSQISAGFLYRDQDDPTTKREVDTLHHEKLEALKEIIDGTGSPVLVFYRYVEERDAILAALPGVAHSIDEKGSIDRWNAGQIPVLLAHPASAGHGLNLQYGGHTIVWTSLTWSLEEWEQGNGRIARQGQRHPVMIHLLMAADVDHAQRARVLDKASVQDALTLALKGGE